MKNLIWSPRVGQSGGTGALRRAAVCLWLAIVLPVPAFAGDDAGLFSPGSWRIVAVAGEELPANASAPAASGRVPSFDLAMDGGSFSATIGCNLFGGQVSQGASSLDFGPARATRMACPPPLDRLETGFARALEDTVAWARDGDMITLSDRTGAATLVLVRAIDN